MQSDGTIDLMVKNPHGTTYLNNPYSYHAEDNMPFLKDVYNQKIPMFSQAYAILANTIEQFYKGIYIELRKINPKVPPAKDAEFHAHHFDNFVKKIHSVMPVSKTRDGYLRIMDDAARIHKGYTDSKYYAVYDYADFVADYQRFQAQRDRLFQMLNAERLRYEERQAVKEEVSIVLSEEELDLYR